MRKLQPKYKEVGYEGRGNRLDPGPPRLVAKVCEEEGRGELWLGPLPTDLTMDRILDTKPSIQIFCLDSFPDRVQAEPDGEWGRFIPGTKAFRCVMSNPQVRSGDVQALRSCLINSLRQGDNAYVHCVSGISEAPMTAALLSAMLMRISFEEALRRIEQPDSLEFSFVRRKGCMFSLWIDAVLSEEVAEVVAPAGYSCQTLEHNVRVVHATAVAEGSVEPICSWRRDTSPEQDFKHGGFTVGSIEEAASQFGGKFCISCERMLKASLKIQVNQFFG